MKNMGIGKQAKILTDKQQNLVLNHLEKSRYPLRNKVIFMLSFKAGLRAKEISGITWSMVCNSESEIGQEITLENKVSKGKYSGRVVPMHKDLRILLVELLKQRKRTEGFNLAGNIVFSERGCKISPQAVVNFFFICTKISDSKDVLLILDEELLLPMPQKISHLSGEH